MLIKMMPPQIELVFKKVILPLLMEGGNGEHGNGNGGPWEWLTGIIGFKVIVYLNSSLQIVPRQIVLKPGFQAV